ncbi:hypothetical protein TrLO_g8391, partial [Triparma laevis f. longispina]
MKTLPSVRHIESVESEQSKRYGKINDSSVIAAASEEGRPEGATEKCVYNYEDRYRLLSSDTLIFDSHFESGNLNTAYLVTGGSITQTVGNTVDQEYDLTLSQDLNSCGHNQWYYFSCSNTKAGKTVRFNITNLGKPDSLYNRGMRPLMYSQSGASREGGDGGGGEEEGDDGVSSSNVSSSYSGGGGGGSRASSSGSGSDGRAAGGGRSGVRGWRRVGKNIKYYCNNTPIPKFKGEKSKGREKGNRKYYTMTFEHTFENSSDVCFFAMCYPYTYTDLRKYLYNLQINDETNRNFRRERFCETLAGNEVDLVTVTEFGERGDKRLEKRLGVVITARVHPGESNASWIMEGILKYLTSNTPSAVMLRKKFVFKIIPMLNPDGVINGNYRTSLAGVDLNRRWDNPDYELHPTIYKVKELVARFKKCRRVVLQCDIHGHSRKEGLFVYGCVPDASWRRYIQDRERKKVEKEQLEAQMEKRREKERLEQEEKDSKKVLAFGKAVESSRPMSKKKERTMGVGENGNGNGNSNIDEGWGDGGGGGGEGEGGGGYGGVKVDTASNEDLTEKLRARMFPRIFDSKSDTFVFYGCNFKVAKSKSKTMRVVMYDEFDIACSYTLEASFSGLNGYHFCMNDLRKMGEDFCDSLVAFGDYLEIESVATTKGGSATTRGGFGGEEVGFPLGAEGFGVDEESGSLGDSFGESSFENYDVPATSPLRGKNNPLNDLLQAEMQYLTSRMDDDGEGQDSAGSESDPSGDNLNEKELRKRMEGKKKRKKRKGGVTQGKRLVRNSLEKAREKTESREGREIGGGGGGGSGRRRSGGSGSDSGSANWVTEKAAAVAAASEAKTALKLPKRPPGKKSNRRSFTEGLYSSSRTPRSKSSSEKAAEAGLYMLDRGGEGVGGGVSGVGGGLGGGGLGGGKGLGVRNDRKRAQSASTVERRGSRGEGEKEVVVDPRFVMEGNIK